MRLVRGRSPQARPATVRMWCRRVRRPRRGSSLHPRFALYVLHRRGSGAPRRDQPRVLASRSSRSRPVVDPADVPPDAGRPRRVLSSTRRAARAFASRVDASDVLRLYQQGELDIVTYFPAGNASLDDIDAASERVLSEAMSGSDPVFVSVLRVTAGELARRHRDLARASGGAGGVRVLRSVLMKPESELVTADLVSASRRSYGPCRAGSTLWACGSSSRPKPGNSSRLPAVRRTSLRCAGDAVAGH